MADILISGSIGSGGAFAILGAGIPEIVGDANLTLTQNLYTDLYLRVTSDGSMTTSRDVIGPLVKGWLFILENATSEGYAVTIRGASGSGVAVYPGTAALVYCDGAGYRQLGVTSSVASALLVTDWYVDQANATGLASDKNSGQSAGAPLLTEKEIANRVGGWSPEWRQAVTIHYLSTTPLVGGNDVDPSLWSPFFINGATLTQTAVLPAPTFTGTLNAVTSKSVAGKQALTATFTTTTGAISQYMLLINATRGNSRAIASVDTGGGNWRLSQPQDAYTAAGGIPAEHDDWAHGDAITGYVLIGIGLAKLGGQTVDPDQTSALQPSRIVQNLRLHNTTGLLQLDMAVTPVIDSCQIERVLAVGGVAAVNNVPVPMISGCAIEGDINSTETTLFVGPLIAGGVIASPDAPTLSSVILGNDVLIETTIQVTNASLNSNVYVAAGATIDVSGQLNLGGQIVYGPGGIDIITGTVIYRPSATVALQVATLTISGQANAYSNATTAGVVSTHRLAISAAALDAAAGAAGFGGLAYIPGVGGYTLLGAAP